jgi:hypothetical protein
VAQPGPGDQDAAFDIQLDWASEHFPPSLNDVPGEGRTETRDDGGDAAADGIARPSVSTPFLPTLLGNIETVNTAIAALGFRVDAVGATLQGLQSVVLDRLVEHIDAISVATRSQRDALDEYRRGNERAVSELRKATTANDKATSGITRRVEEISTDVRSLADLSSTIAGQQPHAVGVPSDLADELVMALTPINDELLEAITKLQSALDTVPQSGRAQGEGLAEELARVREELTQVKRRVGLRGRAEASLTDEQLELIAESVATKLPTPTLSDDDFDRLADAIVDKLSSVFEVISDDVADDPPPKPKSKAAPKTGARRSTRSPRA